VRVDNKKAFKRGGQWKGDSGYEYIRRGILAMPGTIIALAIQ